MKPGAFKPPQASALVVALLTIAVLSLAAGYFISSVTARTRTAFRSASWSEAGLTAESAADMAVAEIRRLVPTSLPDLLNIADRATSTLGRFGLPEKGIGLEFHPTPLQHSGEGNTVQTAVVLIEAPINLRLNQLGNGQWLKVRATGTASVPGRVANSSKLDNKLRRLRLIEDDGTPMATPVISRTIELIVRPVLPFETALLTEGSIDIPQDTATVDSYNSLDPLGRLFESDRRRSNGGVFTNGSNFNFAGRIYGDAGTNGGTLASSDRVTGSVSNQFYQRLAPINAPNWGSVNPSLSTVTTPKQIKPTLLASTRYRLAEISKRLRIRRGGLGTSSHVQIFVTGDITGEIELEEGMSATIYVAGNVRLTADHLRNENQRPESLLIYGVQPPDGEQREIELGLGSDIYASIYAPGHALRLTGDGDLMGSFTAKSITATGSPRIHYDEALKLRIGSILDFRVVNWVEDVQ